MRRFLPHFWIIICFVNVSRATDTLRVGYNIAPPFITAKNDILEGPSIWLLEELAVDHNLEYEMVQMPLDSLLLNLSKGNLDLCASPLTITSGRSEYIYFTAPYYIAHSSLLIQHVSHSEKNWAVLKSFFSLAFFEALSALAVVILIFGFLTWLFERKKNPEEFGEGMRGLWNGFWWSAVTMTTVGYGDKSPKTPGGRLVAIIWMFTAIVIISGFTASIASSLTTSNIDTADEDIEGFKDRTLGTIAESGTENWLTDNFYSDRLGFNNMNSCLNALRSGQIDAIAYDLPILKSVLRNDAKNEFELVDTKFNPQYYAMGISMHLSDSLRNELNTSVIRHTERIDWKVLLTEYNLEVE